MPDLSGEVYSRWTVVEDHVTRDKHSKWLCRCVCDCGVARLVARNDLKSGKTKSCGCYKTQVLRSRYAVPDMTGQRFGRLVVVGAGVKDFGKPVVYPCLCDCGSGSSVTRSSLLSGNTQSCGCLKIERTTERSTKHGLCRSVEYKIWCGLQRRCYDKAVKQYADYGGRGVTICERWKDFKNFYDDMGDKPSPEHSIDRIDNDGNYEPANCRWATRKEQNSNKRNNVYVTAYGKTLTITAWSNLVGISVSTLSTRALRGLDGPLVLAPTSKCKAYKGPLCVRYLDSYTDEELQCLLEKV